MKGLILHGDQPVKNNSVYNNQYEKSVFLNSSSIMRARRLREAFTRSILEEIYTSVACDIGDIF